MKHMIRYKLVAEEWQMSSNEYLCAASIVMPQPNKTKLPLQVLAVTKGN